MQGRFTKPDPGRIQYFPIGGWKREFRVAKSNGFSLMEWTIDDEPFDTNPFVQRERHDSIRDLCREYDIRIQSITCDCFMDRPLWDDDSESREINIKRFGDIILACDRLCVGIIVIPIVDNSRIDSEVQASSLRGFLDHFNKEIESRPIKIAFETDLNPEDSTAFIRDMDPAIYGINYDIGNSASSGFDPGEEISLYGNRIINVHVKDRELGGGTVPLGVGNADIKHVIQLLEETGYSGNYILQTARDYEGRDAEVLVKYRDMTREFIEEANSVR